MSKSNKSGKVTIYLVRHAQTSGNVGMKIMEAHEDILTDLGKLQTNLLGMHLSPVKFDHAYSSDYGRALKTAEGVLKLSKASSEVPLQSCEELREVNFGIYETTSYKETFAYCKSLKASIFDWEFPEGESFQGSGQRMLKFIQDVSLQLIAKHGKDNDYSPTVLIVGHSAAIAFFLYALCETTLHEVVHLEKKDLKLMRNTCYMKFEVELDSDADADVLPKTEVPLRFRFLEKIYSEHLDCVKAVTKDINPLLDFAKSSTSGNDYVGCIQQ